MTEYRKVYAYHEKNDGMYELKSYWTSSETTQFESGENLEEYRSTTENNINLKADRIEYDLDAGMLYLYSDETKIDEIPFRVSIKPKVNLGDIDDLQITQDNSAIKLSWDDPIDIEFSGLKIVEWAGTKVVRKIGSCPDSIEDGTLVIDNKTRNAYSSTPYSDNGLTNGVEYYYRFFPYDTEGNIIGDTCGEIIRVITLVPIEIPTITGTYTYTGSTITPTFVNYDSDTMTRSGANSAKNAGTYTVTFTPKEGYVWTDTTIEPKEVSWIINPATISIVPSQSGILTYNEQSQSPTWSNYNSDQLTISGDTSGTNVGNYTAVFTPKANYTWGDGSVSKSVTWSIGKANGYINTSANSVVLEEQETKTITINSMSSELNSYTTPTHASISVNMNADNKSGSIEFTHLTPGLDSMTIYDQGSGNYNNTSKTIEIICNEPKPTIRVISGSGSNKHYKYSHGTWVEEAAPLNQQWFVPAVVFENNICMIGDVFQTYNGTWNKLSARPYRMYGGCSVVYNNEIHVLGGSSYNYSHYKTNTINGTWGSVSTLPYSFTYGSAVVYNDELYILGGMTGTNYTTNFYKYKSSTNTWEKLTNIPKSYSRSNTALVYDNAIHIFGSMDNPRMHYKYSNDVWTSVSTLSADFYDGCAVVYNDEVHILGGAPNSFMHYKFNSSTNTWVEDTALVASFKMGISVVY